MKVINQTPFMTTAQIGEATSALDSTHSRVLKTIQRLQSDFDTRRAEIKGRWLKTRQANLNGTSAVTLQGIEAQELAQAFSEIKKNGAKELDQLLKQVGASHALVIGQRLYYESAVQVLSREGLGSPERTSYALQLQGSISAELGHLGQFAVGTQNKVLAAAILSRIDRLPRDQRPFSAEDLASSMQLDTFVKVGEYIKIAEARLQGTLVAIRAWSAGRSNPLSTVSLALRAAELDSELLSELEVADAE